MSSTTGGMVGCNVARPHPMKADTYAASEVVCEVAASNYYALTTTATPGAKVVPFDITIGTDHDAGSLVEEGFFWAKSTAVMKEGWPVVPSASAAGKVDPAADASYSTPPTAAEINASRAKDRCIFAKACEIVDGTTNYYLFKFI
ncbi:MAG: hypothetical protein HXS54_05830 [Theionarchaea archaeon]|nr:hypothetical protein [Theionarchaea archaeon]DBA34887.1 TPA_asm: hypothetical protein vir521_00093 [Caudoviricetes sp. vir521]